MNVPKDAVLLRIFFGEEDRFEGNPLHEAIVRKAREMHVAGASATPAGCTRPSCSDYRLICLLSWKL